VDYIRNRVNKKFGFICGGVLPLLHRSVAGSNARD